MRCTLVCDGLLCALEHGIVFRIFQGGSRPLFASERESHSSTTECTISRAVSLSICLPSYLHTFSHCYLSYTSMSRITSRSRGTLHYMPFQESFTAVNALVCSAAFATLAQASAAQHAWLSALVLPCSRTSLGAQLDNHSTQE